MTKSFTLTAVSLVAMMFALTGAAPAAEPEKTMQVDLGCGASMDLVLIPAGEFSMGAPEAEKERQPHETPVHKVQITQPFYMGKYEVTNAQYRAFRPDHHSGDLDGPDQPALYVSWHDADAFCRWLAAKLGKNCRLPTEADWEYACRAGTTTRFYTGDAGGTQNSVDLAKAGWSGGISGGRSKPVGQKAANAFGLYDMHGNAWEWCADWFDPDYYKSSPAKDPAGPDKGRAKVLRGGAYWHWETYYFRSDARYAFRPDGREPVTGFRVVVETGKYTPRPEPKVTQPWPPPREIAPAYQPADDREAEVAGKFGAPAALVQKADAPKIDGKLDDAMWQKARPISFRFLTGRAALPEGRTVAKVSCDDNNLYFAFDCSEPDMDRLLVAGQKRDDAVWQGDTVEVFLDPAHEQKADGYYHIAVNPAGVTMDTGKGDPKWDPDLKVATTKRADGWTVELAVPFKDLGVAGAVPDVWGMNLTRYRPEFATEKPKPGTLVPHSWPVDRPDLLRGAEDTGWSPTFTDTSHVPGNFGHAIVAVGTKKTPPPEKLFELIARADFAEGAKGKFSLGTVEKGGYMGVGNALRFAAKDGAALFQVPLKNYRGTQLLVVLKTPGNSQVYWHTFGKIHGTNKACPRQVITLAGDFTAMQPTFNYCDGAGRIDLTSRGVSDPYYAGFSKHLSWFSEPTIGRIHFTGPEHWSVVYTRVDDLQTQHPDNKRIDPDKDELPGWFFHPGGDFDLLIAEAVMFKGLDNQPPAAPAGVKAATADGKTTVTWNKSADNTLTVWYKVLADDAVVAEVAALSVELTADKVAGKTLTVRAVDFFENVSQPSESVKVK